MELPHTIRVFDPSASLGTRPGATAESQALGQTDNKETLQKQAILEALGYELIAEARTRLAIKQVDEEGKGLVMCQINKLEEELKPISMTSRPIGFQYISQVNQMRALIHDMQVTKPPLLDRIMAQAWLAKIPD